MARERNRDVVYVARQRLCYMSGRPDVLPGEVVWLGRLTPDEIQLLIDMGAIEAMSSDVSDDSTNEVQEVEQ